MEGAPGPRLDWSGAYPVNTPSFKDISLCFVKSSKKRRKSFNPMLRLEVWS
jgi:hypothetical protein